MSPVYKNVKCYTTLEKQNTRDCPVFYIFFTILSLLLLVVADDYDAQNVYQYIFKYLTRKNCKNNFHPLSEFDDNWH